MSEENVVVETTKKKSLAIVLAVVVALAVIASGILGIMMSKEKKSQENDIISNNAVLAIDSSLESFFKEPSQTLIAENCIAVASDASEAATAAIRKASAYTTDLPTNAVETGSSTPTVATKTGGNFMASAYNGNTGIGNLAYWRSINSDAKAWIKIPGTNINFPVMQSASADHYYEHRNNYGTETRVGGAVWTPSATTFGSASTISANTILFGHNWNNCKWNAAPNTYYAGMTQFEALMSYHYTSWAQKFPYIYYSTPSENMTFVVFATFYTENSTWYLSSDAGSVGSIISQAKSRSRSTFDVDVNSSDKILTLSTCTRFYGNTSNQRFVVMARLLRPGEVIGPVNVTYNPNHQEPRVWG